MKMTEKSSLVISSEIIDSSAMYTLEELCRFCNVETEWIVELVEHGVVEPAGQTRSDWKFDSFTVVRVAKARRLGRDLDLSPSGLAVVLELLDEIDELRIRLASLKMTTPGTPHE
jgi:chaperone modulatory protein CbpM